MKRLPAVLCLTSALVLSYCTTNANPVTNVAPTPADAFMANIAQYCGQSFSGRIVANNPPVDDDPFEGQSLVMQVRECTANEIRIPFHVGNDHSRTWILTRTDDGLRLKHDHRHEDGSDDAVTMYGGDTEDVGTAMRQEFPVDQFSIDMFTHEGLMVSLTNVWAMEIHPGRHFYYELARRDSDRLFRVEFDLGQPVSAPPPPWGRPNTASDATTRQHTALRASLPFEDDRDFAESQRGFIAAPPYDRIMGAAGNVVWDMGRYEFLLNGQDYDSIHPSLQRQATLNMNYGLYEVVPDFIYQIRGYDLANMTLIRGETGWILFDVLLTSETAAAALAFANEQLGELPVTAIVYSHSHIDHFGGVRGVVDEADVSAGRVQIYAPVGFMEEAISENVYAGNAMTRRASYQYGNPLPASPFGQVDSAIGKGLARGSSGLIAPTVVVTDDFEEHMIDGVRVVFQNTPGTEAPAEMNAWFPDSKVFWAAENITATIHNIYTLRGALVRDALSWSRQINEALYRFGRDAEVMVSSHNWPRWGNERIQEVMRDQRDAYANLNNQVLNLANRGVTINQMHNEYQVPQSLQQSWAVRQYHGSEFHNSRAVINRYLGYWDGNPATLAPLSPEESAPEFVSMMGGANAIMKRSDELVAQGNYRLAMELLNKLVYGEPGNQAAKSRLADVFEQLGYQYESTSMRNVFLTAAQELRYGIAPAGPARGTSPDLARAMTTSQWWDAVATRVDSRAADGMAFIINFVTPDTGEQFVIEMRGGTLTNISGYQSEQADATIRMNRSDLDTVIMGQATLATQLGAGRGQVEGNVAVLQQLASVLVEFDPTFEIMPGTKH
ncbi:alkyl/aryl-sulfatase [Pseudohongiella spirulinae]|uniref:Alkyl/aryl-sulfatase BDS1 n=1 Tax=Pseudohongiella spirulinae TaxID=1249552 RepID=A0A0S2KA77_9GAMM|nr:Alkyl/aryl-sulfatase BDS1 [Pseudohongiella spirulinae]